MKKYWEKISADGSLYVLEKKTYNDNVGFV